MIKFILVFLLVLLLSPKESFQINIKTNSNNIYKNYDLSELKKEYESIISDYNLNNNNNEYEKDLSNIYNQLNNIQFSNFTNFNDLDWFINNNNNKEINDNNTNNLNIKNNDETSSKIKIGIIVSSFEGMYSTSGIGTVYSILADFLVSKGDFNVTVIYTRDDPPEKKSFFDWKIDLASRGINLVSLPSSPVRIDNPLFVRKSYQVYQYLLGQSFDVLHFPDFEGMAYYSCIAKSNGVEEQFRNVKIVVGLHGPSIWVSSSNGQRQKATLDHDQVELDWMERKSVEMADVIWTPSNYIVQWLVKEQGWSIPQDRLYLLPFLPPKPLSSSIVNTKKASSLIKEIVFFGRLEIRKGIVLFCDALDQLMDQSKIDSTVVSFDSIKSLKITFLGRSSSVDSIDSIDYIRDRSVKWSFSRVDFLEEKSSTESLEYLTDDLHKLVVIPSLDDNAPYTLYECLYSRIPFIATNQPSMIPLIQENDHSSVLFESNSDSLVKKLQSIIAKGKQLIGRPTFSKEKSQQLWLNFYKLKIVDQTVTLQDNQLKTKSTSKPLISICLTHYNRPTFLKQAIESIVGQDYSNYEIILVDDGSTTTESIDYLYSLKNLFKKREWKIIMTENKYLGAARNTAAASANGKYLLFLDDDNYLYPNALSTYLEIAENTGANVVSSPHSIFNSTNVPTTEGVVIQRQWVPLGPSLSVGLFKNCFGDANFFIEKQTFDSVGGFTEEIGVGLEDHEILAKLVIDGFKLQVSTQPLLYYRIHDESNQMVFTTDTKSNQMRYIRPFSSVLSDGFKPVLKVLASKTFQQHATSKRLLVDRCNITLSSIQPNYGPPSGGTLVSIIGSGFDCGVSSVLFGGASCSNPKVRTDAILTCTTPSVSKPGTVDVVVKGSDGSQVSFLEGFTFENTIAVKSCSLGSAKGNFFSCSISKPADTSDSSCSHIFSGNTLTLFGTTAPTCQWTSSTLLMVTFGTSPKASVGSNLEFVAGGIKSTEGDSNQYQSIPLEPPKDVVVVSIINAPRILDGCSDLILDGSQSKGGNGKPLTYIWSMLGGGQNGQELTNLLSQNNASITIPNQLLTKDIKYSFTLKVMNWLEKEDSSSVDLTKQGGSVLNVEIEGPSKIKMSAIDLTLKGNASLSSCQIDGASTSTASKSIKYLWTIEPTIKLNSAKDYTGTTLLIPASKWVYGTTYNITFSATSGDLSNFDTTTVIISKRPVIAVIKGADKNYPLNTIIKLDASQSIDPSVSNSTKLKSALSASTDSLTDSQESDTGLIYKWSCIIAGKSNGKNGGDCGISIPSRPTISFNSSSLGPGTFYIAVDVTPKDDPTRSGSASATIIIVDTPFIDVSIEKLSSFIDPSQKLILKSIIGGADATSSDLTFSWTMDEGTLQLPLKQAYSTPTNGRNLVLKAGALGPDCLYTFTIHVTNSKTKTTGIASVSFRTESTPEGGDITVSPSSGTVTDSYTVSMGDQWTSNTGIIGYNFRYQVGANGPAVALNDMSNSSEITTYLPPGDITVIGYATSGNGITASKSVKVQVSKDPNTEKVINFLSSIVTNPKIDIYQLSIAIKIANSLVPAKAKSSKLILNDGSGVVNGSAEHILSSGGLTFDEELKQMVTMPDEPNHALKLDLSVIPENPNAEHSESSPIVITKPPSSNKIMSQAAVATQVSQFKATGIQYVLNKITRENAHLSNFGISSVVDLICTSTDLSSSVHPTALRDTMKVMSVVSPMMKKSPVLQSDFVSSIEYLGNVNQHVLSIEKSLGKMDPTFTVMVANVSKDLLVVSDTIADSLLYRATNGEVPVSLNANGLTITTFKSSPHDLNNKGQSVDAGDSKFEIPSGVLEKQIKSLKTDAEISAKYVSIPSNIHFTHKTPTDTTLYPKVVSLELLNANSALSINNLKDSILIDMGKVSASEGKEFKCAWWQESKSQWSTDGCSTTKKSGATYCKCNHLTQFGLLEYASSGKNIWIYVGPIVGGVVFAALLVGTVVIVKRKKNKDKKKKINKTKEQRTKEKEDKKQQEKDSKEAKKKEKEDKKSANAKGKESADKDDQGDQSIPKNKKDKDSFGDENDVQYIVQEFKDIFIEAKKREQLKLLKNHQPISPVSSNGTSGSSTTSTPITSTVQIPTSDTLKEQQQEEVAPSSSSVENVVDTTTIDNNKDNSARVIQKAWKNYCNIKQLRKEAEVEELLDNIGELLSDGEQDPFENEDQPVVDDDENQVEDQGNDTAVVQENNEDEN